MPKSRRQTPVSKLVRYVMVPAVKSQWRAYTQVCPESGQAWAGVMSNVAHAPCLNSPAAEMVQRFAIRQCLIEALWYNLSRANDVALRHVVSSYQVQFWNWLNLLEETMIKPLSLTFKSRLMFLLILFCTLVMVSVASAQDTVDPQTAATVSPIK